MFSKIPILVLFFLIIFLIYYFIYNSISINTIQTFENIPAPSYPPPNFPNYSTGVINNNENNNSCYECSKSNPFQTIEKEMNTKYEEILKMIQNRDIQFKSLTERVSNNENYISKLKDAEKAMNQPPS